MTPRIRRPAAETREHVLDVASELFYSRGIHATGIDVVASTADVASTTLYRLFGSKDGLITAYVERAAQRYRQRWSAAADSGLEPAARILALFDLLVQEVEPTNCRGCLFLIAAAEIADADHPAHLAVRRIKSWTRTLLSEIAAELPGVTGDARAKELGSELALLIEGVYGAVQTHPAHEPAQLARRMAVRVIAAPQTTFQKPNAP